jgi:hypothetical protein
MKWPWSARFLAMLAITGLAATATAQDVLGRLESDIRQASGQPATAPTPTTPPRVALGVVALNEAGHGVLIASVLKGGPAEHAGLKTKDLIVGAGGKPVQSLADLTAILGGKRPGDRLLLEAIRGENRFHIEVTLAEGPGMAIPPAQPSPPPPTGPAARPTESIPPPPTDSSAPKPGEGPALVVPQPAVPNGPQAQIEELRHRIDQLEKRVQELERDLAEARKK